MDFAKFLTDNGLKARQIASYLDIAEPSVSRYVHGKTVPSKTNLNKLLDNPYGWDVSSLVGTSTNVTVKSTGENVTNVNIGSGSIGNKPIRKHEDNKLATIPVIPNDAHAGALGDFADGVFPYQCESIVSPYPQAVCAIKVSGDSMEPRYPSNSIVFLKKVNEKAFVEWGRSYVLDTENGAVLKIVNRSANENEIICQSINEKYQPFEVDTSYIRGWYRVLGTLITE